MAVADPHPPIPASTVALLRDVDGGVEVCMLRRPQRSSFAAGAFVFPGGAVDGADGTGDAAYAVAGVREVLEEVGILIGGAAAGSDAGHLSERIGAARSKLLAGGDLSEALAEQELAIAPERLVYIGHFITPPREGRRYDTRFFGFAAPDDREVRVHAAEAVEGGWHRPESMLGLELPAIMPPTRMMCHEFARLGSVEVILRTLGTRPIEVTDITPELIAEWMALQREQGTTS
ncbi:MAG TPA: NUDIX domain-containing protein [Candidatus Dormibacteraeota bacterium]|jgi:8-oxo-dGTP pyrophosphatase MutT (NUDIX family)|nr:NUDIX domain-containing protein [Candidatus Dormibacteraeota bacterium]